MKFLNLLARVSRQRSLGTPTWNRRADSAAWVAHSKQPLDSHPTGNRQSWALQQQIGVQDGRKSLGAADRWTVHAWNQPRSRIHQDRSLQNVRFPLLSAEVMHWFPIFFSVCTTDTLPEVARARFQSRHGMTRRRNCLEPVLKPKLQTESPNWVMTKLPVTSIRVKRHKNKFLGDFTHDEWECSSKVPLTNSLSF